jgi:hypothetical protein
LPRIPFIFAQGSNQWQCAFNLALDLLLSGKTEPFPLLATRDPDEQRAIFQVVYVAPGMSSLDYDLLREMVAPGGFIDRFVSSGGVAVINAAGLLGEQLDIAPRGVGFSGAAPHDSETILTPVHPYFTGLGYAGDTLTVANFNGWQPTDLGTLTNVPADATVLLRNSDGPALVEYTHGAGRVIVSSLRYCWEDELLPEFATRNLLRYSRFFQGSAATPGPTVTPTPTATATPSMTASTTPSRTRTATETPVVLPGDVDGNGRIDADDLVALIEALFDVTPPLAADVNQDGAVRAADIPALLPLIE